MEILQLLTKALTKKYICDGDHKVCPGVMISWIDNRQEWYIAIHKFPGHVSSRTIVDSFYTKDLEQGLKELSMQWLERVGNPPNPIQQLKSFLK